MDSIQWIALGIVGILFIVDIVTTTVGIQNKKLSEKGFLMKYATDKPIIHILLKFVFLIIAGAIFTCTQSVWFLFWPIAVLVIIIFVWVCWNNYNLIKN